MALLTDEVRQFLSAGTRTGKLGWMYANARGVPRDAGMAPSEAASG